MGCPLIVIKIVGVLAQFFRLIHRCISTLYHIAVMQLTAVFSKNADTAGNRHSFTGF